MVPFNVIFVPVEIFAGAMRGTGYSVVPTLITCICVCVFRVLWLFVVVSRFHTLGMLMLCYPISWVLADIAFCITYKRKKWLRTKTAS